MLKCQTVLFSNQACPESTLFPLYSAYKMNSSSCHLSLYTLPQATRRSQLVLSIFYLEISFAISMNAMDSFLASMLPW